MSYNVLKIDIFFCEIKKFFFFFFVESKRKKKRDTMRQEGLLCRRMNVPIGPRVFSPQSSLVAIV